MPENLCHDLVDEVYGAVVAMPNADRTELDALCSDALVSVLQVFRSSASTVGMCRTFSDKVAASDATEIDVDEAKASWCRMPPKGVKVASVRKAALSHARTMAMPIQRETQVPVPEVSKHGKHAKAKKHHHSKKHHHLRARDVNEVHLVEHVEHVESEVAALAQTTESEAKSWASGVTSFLSS